MEREVLISSPCWDPATRCVGMCRRGIRRGLDWSLGSISLPPREVVNVPCLSVP